MYYPYGPYGLYRELVVHLRSVDFPRNVSRVTASLVWFTARKAISLYSIDGQAVLSSRYEQQALCNLE